MTTSQGARAQRVGSLSNWLLATGHGISQIFFQTNIWTGILILAAFVVADWRMAVLVLLGCAAATITGRALGASFRDVAAGLQGYCGALIGAATFAALGGQWVSYPIAVVGGVLCAPVAWLIVWIFSREPVKRFGLPSTTAPFCIVATGIFLSTTSLHVSSSTPADFDSVGAAFLRSLFTNVSQVVLIDNVWAGGLILLGLFIANWKVGIAAVVGSVVGSLCGFAVGEGITETANGLAGYSGVLTTIALAVVFLRSSPLSWILAVVGAVATAFITLGMHELSGPTYTWPYILTTWAFLVIAYFLPQAKRV